MKLASAPHTLLLPIDPDEWPAPASGIRVDDITFAPKTELHVTLIGSHLGRELHATFDPIFLCKRMDRAFAAQDWQFVRSGRFLQLTKRVHGGDVTTANTPMRVSIIELIELPAMQSFHQALGQLLGRQLPVPPPHVTLYTSDSPQGIGVSRPSRLRVLTARKLEPEALSGAP